MMGWFKASEPSKVITELARTIRELAPNWTTLSRVLRCRVRVRMRWAQSNQKHNPAASIHSHISTSVSARSSAEHETKHTRTPLDTRPKAMKNRKDRNWNRNVVVAETTSIIFKRRTRSHKLWFNLTVICLLGYELVNSAGHLHSANVAPSLVALLPAVEGSLIIGDSAFEVQEIRSEVHHDPPIHPLEGIQTDQHYLPNPIHHGLAENTLSTMDSHLIPVEGPRNRKLEPIRRPALANVAAPLPPLAVPTLDASRNAALEDITDGDKDSRASHDYELTESGPAQEDDLDKKDLTKIIPARDGVDKSASEEPQPDKAIAGKVVDFELESAGGHNKAKIKKKQKEKKMKEAEMFKKWGHKKSAEKKAMDMMHKQHEKKKKSEGHKGKKKWGKEVHGHKKKGKFKKKKWGEKIKKGHGLKKGKKGKKYLKDVGHKDTGFKTVYHKEEWGKSSKWHDINRQKKWDEKSKKWKKKWKKEKGKKYKGNHMKKFEKKKKSGKKYSKKHEDKFKKFKKEKFEKGKKKKMEQKSKKKEGGAKKAAEEMKKKKKKGMY